MTAAPLPTPPAHHDPAGGFRNPWSEALPHGFGDFLKWMTTRGLRPDPAVRSGFPRAEPSFAYPRAATDALSVTWVGHSTLLVQLAGLNVLTDPIWSERASPVRFAGPRRFMPPGIRFEALPPIDLVLLSHDHFDHFDHDTICRLAHEHPDAHWLVPLGLQAPLGERGVRRVRELDWWEDAALEGLAARAIPAQHFSGRSFRRNQTLWCGWVLEAGGRRIYFVGDTGRHPLFREIGERCGPFDLILMPIGAYEPRWFMHPAHLDPDEAVAAYLELTSSAPGRRCPMVAMHWGTFRLTDEPLVEPPGRAREAWERAGLPIVDLWILAHGETREVRPPSALE